MQLLKKTRKELFEEIDKPNANPLPEKAYEYAEWKKCRVNIDYCIEADKHYYSVPYQLIREDKEMEVRMSSAIIEIFCKGKRVASHSRSYNKYGYTILSEHMPKGHREYRERLAWTPSRIIDWAAKTGTNTADLVKKILESKKHPEIGYRSSLGIIRLVKYYTKERIEKACKRALKYKLYSYKSVKNILNAHLEQQEEETADKISIMHENVRGDNYWQ